MWDNRKLSSRYILQLIYQFVSRCQHIFTNSVDEIYSSLLFILNIAIVPASFFVPKRENLWVLGSHFGYADNSKYMFLYLNREVPKLQAVWVARDKAIVERLSEEGYPVLYAYSPAGFYYLLRARVVLVTRALSDVGPWGAVIGTETVLLGHGIPMMKSTYTDDRWTHFIQKLSIKNFTHFLLTSNDNPRIAYEQTNYYSIDSVNTFVANYPRTDVFFDRNLESNQGSVENLNELQSRNKTIFYLPTKRSGVIENPLLDSEALVSVDEFLDSKDANLIIKPHPNETSTFSIGAHYDNISVLSGDVDVYPLLREADILITDYSSVFVDYLLLDRPIIFFPYDFKSFCESRQMIFEYETITPGPTPDTVAELLKELQQCITTPDYYAAERSRVRDNYCPQKGGNAAAKVYQLISDDA